MNKNDPFAEISRKRFQNLDQSLVGRRGMLFRYFDRGVRTPILTNVYMAGLWVVGGREEDNPHTTHGFPYGRNYEECEDLIRGLGFEVRPSATSTFIGLKVGKIVVDEALHTTVEIGDYNLMDYAAFATDPAVPLKNELEARFGVKIL